MKISRSIALLFILGALVAGVSSCGGQNSKKKAVTARAAQAESNVLEVDGLLASADDLAGEQVVVEGVCTHICKHGGGKIFLMGSDDTKTIRIEAGDKVGKFKPETVNSVVRVEGTLRETRIDEQYLASWEEQVKSQTAPLHGDGEAGCDAEQKANNEAPSNSVSERIANFRSKIAERNEAEGKDYLSFYYVEADSYTIE